MEMQLFYDFQMRLQTFSRSVLPFIAIIAIGSSLAFAQEQAGASPAANAANEQQAAPTPVVEAADSLPQAVVEPPKFGDVPPDAAPDLVDTAIPAEEAAVEKAETSPAAKPVFWKDRAYVTFGAFFLVLAGSFYTANFLAKRWRMPDHSFRFFATIFCLIGALVSSYLGWHRMSLGIDLRGGSMLVYDAKPSKADDGIFSSAIDMEALQKALKRRIDPAGIREISIAQLGTNQIKIVIPQAEDSEVSRIQRVISESGTLEFRILANRQFEADAQIITKAEQSSAIYVNDSDGHLLAFWTPVAKNEVAGFVQQMQLVTRGDIERLEILVLKDIYDVKGGDLSQIYSTNDEQGQPAIGFNFKQDGARRFGNLTGMNLPNPAQPEIRRQLGILMNGELYSAPRLNSRIEGRGIIEFGIRNTDAERLALQKEIADLIDVMRAGALPAELSRDPVSNQRVGAMLGQDTIEKGTSAIALGAGVVLIFMVVYYRFAGVVACFCVLMNLAMIIAAMLTFHAAFTLPGLAGLVLTIGMAVDANILIFERMREELNAGASLKMAIRNGFDRAFSAIIDSNVTTLITAVILYAVGSEQVKGFAVTLFLGVTFSMFTAIYCARGVFDAVEKTRFVKTLSFLQFFERPNINFMGVRDVMLKASAIAVVICVLGTFIRGKGILDIDFVGGVSVEMQLKSPKPVDEIRTKLSDLPDLAVTNVQIGEISKDGDTRFIINTSSPIGVEAKDFLGDVTEKIKSVFGDLLVFNTLKTEIVSNEPIPQTDADIQQGISRAKFAINMTFSPEINAPSLESSIKAAIEKASQIGTVKEAFPVEIAWAKMDRNQDDGVRFSDWTVTTEGPQSDIDAFLKHFEEDINSTPDFPTSTTIGSAVAGHTRDQAILAILGSLICIVGYMRIRFHNMMFGLAAVISLVFNVVITLGLLALSKWLAPFLFPLGITEFKIGLPVIAAFLTIIGYTLNDTIILFDRIREVKGKSPKLTLGIVNLSINQTLSRTVITAATTFFTVFALYLFGGQGIHTFAFAMCVGVVVGTYSTIFVAAPLLYRMSGEE